MGLNITTTVQVKADLINAIDLGVEPTAKLNKSYVTNLINGTAVGQADRIFLDTRSLAGAATENLDLAGGVLFDPLGTALTFAKIKGLLVAAPATNPGDIIMGGDVTNTFFSMFADETDAIRVRPGEVLAKFCGSGDAAGYAVVAGTGDLLKFLNGHASLTGVYDVVIYGTSV